MYHGNIPGSIPLGGFPIIEIYLSTVILKNIPYDL